MPGLPGVEQQPARLVGGGLATSPARHGGLAVRQTNRGAYAGDRCIGSRKYDAEIDRLIIVSVLIS